MLSATPFACGQRNGLSTVSMPIARVRAVYRRFETKHECAMFGRLVVLGLVIVLAVIFDWGLPGTRMNRRYQARV